MAVKLANVSFCCDRHEHHRDLRLVDLPCCTCSIIKSDRELRVISCPKPLHNVGSYSIVGSSHLLAGVLSMRSGIASRLYGNLHDGDIVSQLCFVV
jgi:hypothetical protein